MQNMTMFGPSGPPGVHSAVDAPVLTDAESLQPSSDDVPITPANDPRMKRRRERGSMLVNVKAVPSKRRIGRREKQL